MPRVDLTPGQEASLMGRARALVATGQRTTVRALRAALLADGQPDVTLTRLAQLIKADTAAFIYDRNGGRVERR